MGEKIFKKIGKYLVPYLVASMINTSSITYAKQPNTRLNFAEKVMEEANAWYNSYSEYAKRYPLRSFFPDFERMEEYRSYIEHAARESNLDKCTLMGLIAVESRGRLCVKSEAGALGPMQLMPDVARRLGIPITKWEDRRCSVDSIAPAAKYFARLIRKHGGLADALIAYNAGEDNACKVDNIDDWEDKLEYIPRQTENYVPKVIAAINACQIYEEERGKSRIKVKPGDNLSKIVNECNARGFNVSLPEIKQINHIDNQNKIYVGQTIYCSGKYNKDIYANAKSYQVARGDNLDRIARKHGVSIDYIKKLNPQVKKWSMLKPGMVLRVPKSIRPRARITDERHKHHKLNVSKNQKR